MKISTKVWIGYFIFVGFCLALGYGLSRYERPSPREQPAPTPPWATLPAPAPKVELPTDERRAESLPPPSPKE